MPELYVEPQALADAGRSLATQRTELAAVAGAVGPALAVVAAALPGSRTAEAAELVAAELGTDLRSAATELAVLGGALTAAAREYETADRSVAAGIERAGRRAA